MLKSIYVVFFERDADESRISSIKIHCKDGVIVVDRQFRKKIHWELSLFCDFIYFSTFLYLRGRPTVSSATVHTMIFLVDVSQIHLQ